MYDSSLINSLQVEDAYRLQAVEWARQQLNFSSLPIEEQLRAINILTAFNYDIMQHHLLNS